MSQEDNQQASQEDKMRQIDVPVTFTTIAILNES